VAPDGVRPSDAVKRYDVRSVLTEPWVEPPLGDVRYRSITRRAAYYPDLVKPKLSDEIADAICDKVAAISAALRHCRARVGRALGIPVDAVHLPAP